MGLIANILKKRGHYEEKRIRYCSTCRHHQLCGLDPIRNEFDVCPCADCILKTNCTKKCNERNVYILDYDF